MRVQQIAISKTPDRAVRYVYLITVLFLTISGFGQMPIFKRYYIADIPGFGWLAQFFVTHYIHYIRLTASGYVRGTILAGILVSGLLLVIRNLAGSRFAPGFIIFLDIAHLGMVVTFLIVAGYCLVRKRRWVTQR